MLTNVKAWIETTGIKVAEVCFSKPPAYPYINFLEDIRSSGADNKICLYDRNITLELYSEKINHEAELKIENLLNERSIEYEKSCTWIDSERCFQTVYNFNLVEKV